MSIINSGFGTKRSNYDPTRVPPGQHTVSDFPVLSYGPTPHTLLSEWSLTVDGLVDNIKSWSWQEFLDLQQTEKLTDIHCVTHWTKFDTKWVGVTLDYLFEQAVVKSSATHILASCDGGYTTNLPLVDVLDGKAMVVYQYDGKPLEPAHGGPARLFVPHLYFWKSAKWIRKITLLDHDQPGFWEVNGYHNHGNPWKEERYSGE